MIWLLSIVLIVAFAIAYIVFAPFYFEIDSKINLLQFRFHNLASLRLVIEESGMMIEIKVAGFSKQIDLLNQRILTNSDKPVVKKKTLRRNKISSKRIKQVIKSFKVNKCSVELDTGDVQWNGILFPFFFMIGNIIKRKVQINFEGRNELELEVENSIARMIWAYIYNK